MRLWALLVAVVLVAAWDMVYNYGAWNRAVFDFLAHWLHVIGVS